MSLNLSQQLPRSAKKTTCLVLVIIFGALFLALASLIVYRSATYYQKIKAGEVIDLPQFGTQLTRATKIRATNASATLETIQSTNAISYGPKDAKLTLVQFSDFDCPYSAAVEPAFRSLSIKYKNQVRIIYRQFPLEDLHPNAPKLAEAAECAGEQNKFQEYYDKLFLNQGATSYSNLLNYAKEIGLEATKFSTCLSSGKFKTKVSQDLADGAAVGVVGTPTFFFNGRKVEGAIPVDTFEALIKEFLSSK